MCLSIFLTPFTPCTQANSRFISPSRITKPTLSISTQPKLPKPTRRLIRSVHDSSEGSSITQTKPRWENILSAAASLYPLYVTVGGVVACLRPSTFSWFVNRGPTSYSLSLGFIMLAMGITLELKDFINLFMQRPLSILFGCVAQYTIMPVSGMIISKLLGLSPFVSVGLILLGCCPVGTASNVPCRIAEAFLNTFEVKVLKLSFPKMASNASDVEPLCLLIASYNYCF